MQGFQVMVLQLVDDKYYYMRLQSKSQWRELVAASMAETSFSMTL